jgi:hypothetical protein
MHSAFAGDLADGPFIRNVVEKSGGDWDLIIDDGGREEKTLYAQQKASFAALWPQLNPGGLYYMEGLAKSSSQDGMIREILGWADKLLSPRQSNNGVANSTWVDWHTSQPPDLLSVHCQWGICAMRKAYTAKKG